MERIVAHNNKGQFLIMANSPQLNLLNSIGLDPRGSNSTPLNEEGENKTPSNSRGFKRGSNSTPCKNGGGE